MNTDRHNLDQIHRRLTSELVRQTGVHHIAYAARRAPLLGRPEPNAAVFERFRRVGKTDVFVSIVRIEDDVVRLRLVPLMKRDWDVPGCLTSTGRHKIFVESTAGHRKVFHERGTPVSAPSFNVRAIIDHVAHVLNELRTARGKNHKVTTAIADNNVVAIEVQRAVGLEGDRRVWARGGLGGVDVSFTCESKSETKQVLGVIARVLRAREKTKRTQAARSIWDRLRG